MFSISDIIGNAQGGNAIANLAQQFGLSQEQAQSAVDALVPAVSSGLQKQASDPAALGNVVSTVAADGAHKEAFADPQAAFSPQSTQLGGNLLEQIFGAGKTGAVAQQASQVSGVSPDILQQMLPVIMSMVAGGLFHGMQNQGLGGILGQLAGSLGGGGGAGGGLGGILGSLIGGGGTAPQQTVPDPAPAQPASGGGIGGMIGSVLGGLFGGNKSEPAPQPQSPAGGGGGGLQGGLESLINMFQPGQRVPPEQQRQVDDILDRKT